MADDKHDIPTKVGGEAGSGAATQERQGSHKDKASDAKPAGVGPVDKKEEVEQQPS